MVHQVPYGLFLGSFHFLTFMEIVYMSIRFMILRMNRTVVNNLMFLYRKVRMYDDA